MTKIWFFLPKKFLKKNEIYRPLYLDFFSEILPKISIFSKNFDFYQKLRFLPKTSIFDQKFLCLTKISIFDQNFYVWPKFQSLRKNFDFCAKIGFFNKSLIFVIRSWFLTKIPLFVQNFWFFSNLVLSTKIGFPRGQTSVFFVFWCKHSVDPDYIFGRTHYRLPLSVAVPIRSAGFRGTMGFAWASIKHSDPKW